MRNPLSFIWVLILAFVVWCILGIHILYGFMFTYNFSIGVCIIIPAIAALLIFPRRTRGIVTTYVAGILIFDVFVVIIPYISLRGPVAIVTTIAAVLCIKYKDAPSLPNMSYVSIRETFKEFYDNYYVRMFTGLIVMCILSLFILCLIGRYTEYSNPHGGGTSVIGWVTMFIVIAVFFLSFIPHTTRHVYTMTLGITIVMLITLYLKPSAGLLQTYAVLALGGGILITILYNRLRPQPEEHNIMSKIVRYHNSRRSQKPRPEEAGMKLGE